MTLAVAAGGALPGASAQTTPEKPSPRLKPVNSCRALARYARRHTKAVVVEDAQRKRREGGPFQVPLADQAPAQGGGGGATEDFSRTNVQEEGIDEPDPVKTDGTHLFVVGGESGDVVTVLDARADIPTQVSSLKLPGYGAELLLAGDRMLAISYGDSDTDAYEGATILSEVDIANPAAMRVLRTEKVDGDYIAARLHGGIVRVAIQTEPREVTVEQPPDEEWSPSERRLARREAVARAPLRTWRPTEVVADRTLNVRTTRGAVPCKSVKRPRVYSGLGMLSVLTVDLERGLPAVDADAVFAGGEVLYAGEQGLYVATEEWIDEDTPFEDLPAHSITAIHKFAIGGAETTYAASGAVPGYMLSQWSMSEHEGYLRVATTNEPPWLEDRPEGEPDNQVIVLADQAGALTEVGRVGGLGRGEYIRAVRFMGDRGFVVTFREADPLYALDLSVPQAPRLAGELKIPGYSAYLHPVGDGLLLGVGQDATERGELRGLQLSLFDVSDMSRPERLATQTIAGDSYTEAEWDHHAFLYWPATGLTLIPAELYSSREEDVITEFSGAIGFHVDTGARTLDEVGRITAPASDDPDEVSPPYRNLVIGDRVFTIWYDGIRVSRLDDLTPTAWVELPD